MSTRALANFIDGADTLCTVYKHWDGYPSEFGRMLKEAILIDECRMETGDLAAHVISKIKKAPKDVYIVPAGTSGMDEDYTYDIYAKDGGWHVTCARTGRAVLYDGPVAEWDTEVES